MDLTCNGLVDTSGDASHGILAQSIGGFTRGAGGAGGLFSWGGSAGSSGIGDAVTVTSDTCLLTSGAESYGILAQSIGGGGGSAGEAGGIYAVGGSGSAGGDGGLVTVTSYGNIDTFGTDGSGIVAQSIGGGGGRARAVGGGFYNTGGAGAAGGNGGDVNVINNGSLNTSGPGARCILAESIGGGGGSGAHASGYAPFISYTYGGNAGVGSNGGKVDIESGNLATTTITTAGDFSHGIYGRSIGGGGGGGGNSTSLTAGLIFDISGAIGGQGGGGGDGGSVDLTSHSQITTGASCPRPLCREHRRGRR